MVTSLGTPRPTVGFSAWAPTKELSKSLGLEPQYRLAHVTQSNDDYITLTLEFDQPATNNTVIRYDIYGGLQAGLDYNIISGQSPIFVMPGARSVDIVIQIPETNRFFSEKTMRLKINKRLSNYIKIDPLTNQFKLIIRPSTPPPVLEFDRETSTFGGSSTKHLIKVNLDGSTETDSKVYPVVDRNISTAVESVDFILKTKVLTIPAGSTFGYVVVEVLRTGEGKRIHLNLQSENSDGSDLNLYGHGRDLRLESVLPNTIDLPGIPTAWLSAGGSPKGVTPLERIVDSVKTYPDDADKNIEGYKHRSGAKHNGYVRKSFEGMLWSDAPDTMWGMHKYTLVAMKVALSTDYDPSRYYQLIVRDRGFNIKDASDTGPDINHIVTFDRESSNPITITDTGSWGIHSVDNFTGLYGVEDVLNPEGGKETWLWVVYREDNSELVGVTASTVLIRPLYLEGNVYGHMNEAALIYDPYVKGSEDPITGPPEVLWPRPGHWWYPRGGATITDGLTNSHTVILS